MLSFLWQLANRTPETQFIFNLFHLLLAGLTLLVLLHQFGWNRGKSTAPAERLLPLGFLLLVSHFALLTMHFGAEFFLRKQLAWAGFNPIAHGLMACGFLLVVGSLRLGSQNQPASPPRWCLLGCAIVAAAVFVDIALFSLVSPPNEHIRSVAAGLIDLFVFVNVMLGMRKVQRGDREGRAAILIALGSACLALVLHNVSLSLWGQAEIFLWNAEQHVVSISLFAFAWGMGERSHNLLDRIFVRLNLTFIVLASLIMLMTAGMEKYQYFRLAEERSMNLAEFLRGHIVYYQTHGENLEEALQHPEVMRRVVVEFGALPELREVNIVLDGRRASFRYTQDWEIEETVALLAPEKIPWAGTGIPNSFEMIRLPIETGARPGNQIALVGTLDFINDYIGHYIILIYSVFTIMVGLAMGIIGMIVADTDRRLRRQYAELQETHQQLAQAAKLASVGQLAGGMAHEINTPITSILSLASHLAGEKSAAATTLRQRKSLQLISQQAQRVSRIVSNLLTFARQSRLEVGQVDVGELLETAALLVQFRLRDSAIRLDWRVGDHLPLILGDASHLTQVFVNLLNNAIDAMPDGGVLTVRASSGQVAGRGVLVEVEDTGRGISPDHLPRIFDPFFTTKEPGRGTGLGLSISHGIVQDHGGQIYAESRPGAGTVLRVTLPKGVERR